MGRFVLTFASFVLILPACTGIPDAVTFQKPRPCEVVVKDNQGHGECISREEFAKWLERNRL